MRTACLLFLIIGLFSAGHVQGFTDDLASVGKVLLDAVVEKGKQFLADTASNLLKDVLPSLLGTLGKREALPIVETVSKLVDGLKALADKGKLMVSKVFTDTLNKLKSLTDTYHAAIGTITDASGIADQIDALVADHHTKQKRVLGDLLQKGKELLAGAVDKAKEALGKLKEKASALVSGALQAGTDVLIGKRALSDHLQAIGDVLSSAVNPFKDVVSGLGDTLKGHFSNLVDTVKGHASALKTKLNPHLDELKGHGQKLAEHGKNALQALSEVVRDILNQTVSNATDSLSGAAKTLQDAGKTVVGHFAGSDSTF